ncbi:MAG TPA: cohesin domain-containing protein [Candidatus Paceibacterota bacterium]|nr:cohesin domain-containing protein [Candidatus Paceibacterota bacterium]
MKKIKNNKNKKVLFLLYFVAILSFLSCFNISYASTEIYFENNSKENKEIFVGDTFSINLKVSSIDKSINVIDGTILYDKDKIEVKEIKNKNSIFSLWVKEPVFDNKIGELSFVAGTPNGFSEKDGQILEIIFLAKNSGKTHIGYKDVFSIFENDGRGTTINPWLKPLYLDIKKVSFLQKMNILSYTTNLNSNFKYSIFIFTLVVLCIIINLLISKFWNKKNDK